MMTILNNYLELADLPLILCPTCKKANLSILDVIKKEPAWLRNFVEEPTTPISKWAAQEKDTSSDIEHTRDKDSVFTNFEDEYHTVVIFQCTSPVCSEVVVSSGVMKHEEFIYNENTEDVTGEFAELYFPKSFTPTIHIFPISKKLPEAVQQELLRSFDLFWISSAACVNALRIAIEKLVDQFLEDNGIVLRPSGNGFIKLDKRITRVKEIDPNLGMYLESIKWIGNAGSHESILNHQDVIDGYKVMMHITKEFYDKEFIEINDIATQVNGSRKPRHT